MANKQSLGADKMSKSGYTAELSAMGKIFEALSTLDTEAQRRVIDYVEDRLGLSGRDPEARKSHSTPDRVTGDRDTVERIAPMAGGAASAATNMPEDVGLSELEGVSQVACKWLQRNGLSAEQISKLYSLGVDEIDLVANNVPGKSVRERFHAVVLLQGIASYLSGGAPRINNEKLKDAMKHYDADPDTNFSAYLKKWATEVSGSRATGDLTLTTRGLNSAKELIKDMISEKADV